MLPIWSIYSENGVTLKTLFLGYIRTVSIIEIFTINLHTSQGNSFGQNDPLKTYSAGTI